MQCKNLYGKMMTKNIITCQVVGKKFNVINSSEFLQRTCGPLYMTTYVLLNMSLFILVQDNRLK